MLPVFSRNPSGNDHFPMNTKMSSDANIVKSMLHKKIVTEIKHFYTKKNAFFFDKNYFFDHYTQKCHNPKFKICLN